MFPFKMYNCTRCLSWLREKCTNKTETISLYPSVTIEVRPQIQQNDRSNIPTMFAEVQELTFDRNGSPKICILNSSKSTSEVISEGPSPQNDRWAFPSVSYVEDLQQSENVIEIINHENSISSSQVKETEEREWKPSSHLHKYFRMMHICGTAPLTKAFQPSGDHQRNWKWVCTFAVQRVNKIILKNI